MRVLLPPSETKNPGGRGRSLAARAPHSVLGAPREELLTALAALVDGPREHAAAALLLPPAVVDAALHANARVRTSATLPALRRYAGVVYDGLGWTELPEPAQRVAARSIYIFSGLLGVVRGDESVPDYRVPAKATLPVVGVAGTYWSAVLKDEFPPMLGRGLVVDLRSSDYAAMWRPGPALARRVVRVRVVTEGPNGPAVISYPSKLAKGQLAAALVTRVAGGDPVSSIDDVAATWLTAGGARAEILDSTHLLIASERNTAGR